MSLSSQRTVTVIRMGFYSISNLLLTEDEKINRIKLQASVFRELSFSMDFHHRLWDVSFDRAEFDDLPALREIGKNCCAPAGMDPQKAKDMLIAGLDHFQLAA
jgi:hypothetical protein